MRKPKLTVQDAWLTSAEGKLTLYATVIAPTTGWQVSMQLAEHSPMNTMEDVLLKGIPPAEEVAAQETERFDLKLVIQPKKTGGFRIMNEVGKILKFIR